MKNVEEMTDRELLMELVREKRLQQNLRRIKIVIAAVIIIAVIWLLAIYVPRMIEAYNRLNSVLQQIQDTGNKVSGIVEEVKNGPLQTIQNGIDSIGGFLKKLGF